MMRAVRNVCFHVPKRCRGLLMITCFSCLILIFMALGQVFAVLLSLAARETQLTEKDIRDVIPMENAVVIDKGINEAPHTKNGHVPVLAGKSNSPSPSVRTSENATTAMHCEIYGRIDYLFVVRIPKSASTSFVDLLRSLSSNRHFYLEFNPSGAFNWDDARAMSVANKLIKLKHSMPKTPLVYARHFYYVNFTKYQISNFKYFTVVRDPVTRFVSSYLYYHFSSKGYIQAALDPKHRNESIVECLEHGHEGCATNLMTKYFCGHELYCKEGSEEALAQAQAHLERDFAVVGVLEELELSYEVLKKVLPEYFHSLQPSKAAGTKTNSNESALELTNQIREIVEKANWADMKLYQFARQRLQQQAKGCGLQ